MQFSIKDMKFALIAAFSSAALAQPVAVFACIEPGHFEAGMKSRLAVKARS